MEYTIAKSAVKIMEVNDILPSDLVDPPLNGKSYTKQDIRDYLDKKGGYFDGDSIEEEEKGMQVDEFFVEKIVETKKEEPKEKKEVATPAVLEFFWEERDKAVALERSGEYRIVESLTIKNAQWGKHKKLILRKL